eukprot:GHVR01028695.1.p1 GENE.GHVR01028695.1~~GHVR01028695.1.p1  ORF type:complete len:458 (-),score=105.57 GHVR01028695.1:18-1391(-)
MKSTSMKINPTYELPWSYRHVLGIMYLIIALPASAFMIGCAMLWYYIDPINKPVRKFIVNMMSPFSKIFVRRHDNHFVVPVALLQAVIQPTVFFFILYSTYKTNYFSFPIAFVYHLVRLGPHFNNYGYVYTLCHKEGHVKREGFFKEPYCHALHSIFNWWVGIFYGVFPSSFSYGHSKNHHRYNNDADDVITTWDLPRDSFFNYVAYIPRFIIYHLNISSALKFIQEGDKEASMKLIIGNFYFVLFALGVARVSPIFSIVYVWYPMIESILLLSAINWSWHGFLGDDPQDKYQHSVTLFDNKEETNILNEDYHVVHHSYPTAHWADHPMLFNKHKDEYIKRNATMLRNTHAIEIFFLIILQQYDVFVEKWVDMSNKLTYEDKLNIVVTRLRNCSWGGKDAMMAASRAFIDININNNNKVLKVDNTNTDIDTHARTSKQPMVDTQIDTHTQIESATTD